MDMEPNSKNQKMAQIECHLGTAVSRKRDEITENSGEWRRTRD